MNDFISFGCSGYKDDPDNEFLAEHNRYIEIIVRKTMPIDLFSYEVIDLEIDEIIQNIRIKLWKAHQKCSIEKPISYIKVVAQTTIVDMVRRHRSIMSLSTDENGEENSSNRLVAYNEGYRDPAYEVEIQEIDADFLKTLVEAILSLPPRQLQSVLYNLKDYRDDVIPLTNALKTHKIDVEAMDPLDDESEIYLFKASLSIARKKLQLLWSKSK